MRVHALQAHPNFNSLNGALYRSAVKFFESNGCAVTTQHIYTIEEELTKAASQMYNGNYTVNWATASSRGSITPFIQAEIDNIKAADLLYIQTPIWMYSIPALLKKYMEQVFLFGEIFTLENTDRDDFKINHLIKNKDCFMSITLGGHPEMIAHVVGGDITNLINPIRYMYEFVGFNFLEPYIVTGTTSTARVDYTGAFETYLERNFRLP